LKLIHLAVDKQKKSSSIAQEARTAHIAVGRRVAR
jgi:hypothetical protein